MAITDRDVIKLHDKANSILGEFTHRWEEMCAIYLEISELSHTATSLTQGITDTDHNHLVSLKTSFTTLHQVEHDLRCIVGKIAFED